MQKHGTYLVFFFANSTFEMFKFIKLLIKLLYHMCSLILPVVIYVSEHLKKIKRLFVLSIRKYESYTIG